MAIAMQGRAKGGMLRMFGRKSKTELSPVAQKTLSPQDVVRLFRNRHKTAQADRPAMLNDSEQRDQQTLSSLRGALYSRD